MLDRIKSEIQMLERHFEVLRAVIDKEPIGIVNLSEEVGYPQHKIRYSLRVLEERDLIEPTESGAVQTEEGEEFVQNMGDTIDDLSTQIESLKIND